MVGQRVPLIAMLTTPRDGASYVERTHAAVKAQLPAGEECLLVVDGRQGPVCVGPTAFVTKKHKGNRAAFFEVIGHAAVYARPLLFLEDDIELCRNAIPYMFDFRIPDGIGWVQFFTPPPLRSGAGNGLHVGPPGTARFLQAAKFSAETCLRLWSWWAASDIDHAGGSDVALGMASKEMQIPWAAHSPDLVQHIGETSTGDNTHLTWWRRSADWPGEEFDANTLRGRPEYGPA